MLFLSTAIAGPATSSIASGFDFMSFLPLILIFGVFYFLLIRPQQKKMRTHQTMLAGIKRGDRILTNGGIIGTISKVVDDKEIVLEIADDVKVRVMRGMIADILSNKSTEQEKKTD